MSETKMSAFLTSSKGANMSRYEMLRWVNGLVQGHFTKIEDLCSGVAYCQMMALIFPKSINQKRVKLNPKLEHEFVHNLRLLQDAFNRLKLDKPVPIDRLVQGRFKHNFEFLQWFKKFYDSQNKQTLANKQAVKPVKPVKPRLLAKEKGPMKKPERANTQILVKVPEIRLLQDESKEEAPIDMPEPESEPSPRLGDTLSLEEAPEMKPVKPRLAVKEELSESEGLGEVKEPVRDRQEEIQMRAESAINIRDLAYRKLLMIEKLTNEVSGEGQLVNLCQRIQAVLMAPMNSQVNEEAAISADAAYPNEDMDVLGIF